MQIKESENMLYNWEGDLILQDTVIEKKRYVVGNLKKQIKTDIREWISFEDNNIMKEILKGLAKDRGLPTERSPGSFDKRATIIWDFVAGNIKYVHDSEKQSKEDFWLFPPEIYTLRQGDCEDGAFLLASLLLASGISPFCVRVVLGEIFDENNKSIGGHCWPVYKNEMGRWCILESTLDNIPARMPEADKLSTPGQSFRYVPYYCFNRFHLWEILPGEWVTSKTSGIRKYLELRGNRVHMKQSRLPSGGWLSHLTGDWEPGHLSLTGAVLRDFGFPENTIDIAGDASQDPDFYDWSTPYAHAQTDNDNSGRTSESKEKSVGKFITWIADMHARLISEAKEDVRSGLFFLGYVLHGIQDLATHKGITNAQHSFVSKLLGKKNDPDHNAANRAKAAEYSKRYLEALKKRHGHVFGSLSTYKGRTLPCDKLMPHEKADLLGKETWDLTPAAFIEYTALAGKYKKIKNEYPIESTLWDAEDVFERMMRVVG